MSHDVSLNCKCCSRPLLMEEPFTDGGTYNVFGTDECELNITYNYGKLYKEVFPDDGTLTNGRISWLYGKTGAESIPILKQGVALLGTERDDDYWKATAGNAGAALARLLSFAEAHPLGVWDGD
jgi:hypothetical protein